MASSSLVRPFPWGNVLFSLVLAGAFYYYAQLVHANSRGVTDWMLVIPASGIGIAALLVVAGTKIIDWYKQKEPVTDAHQTVTYGTVLFIGLLALYVVTLPLVGFDVGSLIFVALTLYLQGEKRWWLLAITSVTVSLIVTFVFVSLLNVRLPTTIF
ncbi:tripartite tricarboxylate transporter TctB family protein [Vreelandella sp. EE22]